MTFFVTLPKKKKVIIMTKTCNVKIKRINNSLEDHDESLNVKILFSLKKQKII